MARCGVRPNSERRNLSKAPHIRLLQRRSCRRRLPAKRRRVSLEGSTLFTVEGVRLARKRMFFSSQKAGRELGYRCRPASEAFADAVRWLREPQPL
jgi:nucleoside-diphosphate-sugar epimerase